jgi:transcriptional regulator with XRE-family HTH domain
VLPVGIGGTLRAAREAEELSLAEVAEKTRITQRHLELIEAGDFAALPGRTYAIGFSRSFAKVVGLNPDEVARAVREELSMIEPAGHERFAQAFEPGDPARVPSARLAWLSALAALVLFVGGSIFIWSSYIAPAGSLPWRGSGNDSKPAGATRASEPPPPATPAPAPAPAGQVTFTALEQGIWVKFYDKSGRTLMQKQMDLGERYTVPADADGPQLWTGRPDALAITVGGKPVAKIDDEHRTVKDVPVSAQALLARNSEAQAPAPPTG